MKYIEKPPYKDMIPYQIYVNRIEDDDGAFAWEVKAKDYKEIVYGMQTVFYTKKDNLFKIQANIGTCVEGVYNSLHKK